MSGSSWRRVDKGTWWLLFDEAPDPVRDENGALRAGEKEGSIWPPQMVAIWMPPGCLHLTKFYNGQEPAAAMTEDDSDYMHICDIDEFVDELRALQAAASVPS